VVDWMPKPAGRSTPVLFGEPGVIYTQPTNEVGREGASHQLAPGQWPAIWRPSTRVLELASTSKGDGDDATTLPRISAIAHSVSVKIPGLTPTVDESVNNPSGTRCPVFSRGKYALHCLSGRVIRVRRQRRDLISAPHPQRHRGEDFL
jgi:hypothetical protein